ncbi:MAG: hypothetical protein QG673_2179, partial [Pseudomonadota bacterium]|nr:hypothetical protein [Pseudomonadota bacterium]
MQRELKPPLKIDIVKVCGVIKSNFKQLLIGTVLVTCVGIIYCVFAPPIYTANTIINPPKLGDSGTGLASAFGGLAALAGANQRAFVLVNDSDTTIAFLKSRYVVDQIIKKFNLVKYYKVKDITVARKTLISATTTIPDAKSGLLEIDVDDKNPKMAADIANTYVTALGRLISSIGLNTALHKREFYDNQIVQVKKDLAQAQKVLQEFMIKNGITAGAQTNIVTGISTQLQAQLAVAQSQLISMQRYATVDN